MGWWVQTLWNLDPVLLVSWAVWVIGSITLHELGHGVAAVRLGDRTPIETGHMTWNPLVHMGTMSLVMFAIVGIAWGAMPVNEQRLRGRYAPAFVALGGPAVNLVLFVLCVVLGAVWVALAGGLWSQSTLIAEPLAGNVETFFFVGACVNALLLALNLLPVPPLDGSRVLATLSSGYRRLFWESEHGMLVGFGLFLLIFFFASDKLFNAGFLAARVSTDLLVFVITGGATGQP